MNRQATVWEKVSVKQRSDKGLVQDIERVLTTQFNKKWAKDRDR